MSLVDNFQYLHSPFYATAPLSPTHTSISKLSFPEWGPQSLEKNTEWQGLNSQYPFESDFERASNESISLMSYPAAGLLEDDLCMDSSEMSSGRLPLCAATAMVYEDTKDELESRPMAMAMAMPMTTTTTTTTTMAVPKTNNGMMDRESKIRTKTKTMTGMTTTTTTTGMTKTMGTTTRRRTQGSLPIKHKMDDVENVDSSDTQYSDECCSTYSTMMMAAPMHYSKKFRRDTSDSNVMLPMMTHPQPLDMSGDMGHHPTTLPHCSFYQPSLSPQSNSILSKESLGTPMYPSMRPGSWARTFGFAPNGFAPNLWGNEYHSIDGMPILQQACAGAKMNANVDIYANANANVNTYANAYPSFCPHMHFCPCSHSHLHPHSHSHMQSQPQPQPQPQPHPQSQSQSKALVDNPELMLEQNNEVKKPNAKPNTPPNDMELFGVLAALTNFKSQHCFGCKQNVGENFVICTKYLQCNRCYCEGCALKMDTSAKEILKTQMSIRKCTNISKKLLESGIFYCSCSDEIQNEQKVK